MFLQSRAGFAFPPAASAGLQTKSLLLFQTERPASSAATGSVLPASRPLRLLPGISADGHFMS